MSITWPCQPRTPTAASSASLPMKHSAPLRLCWAPPSTNINSNSNSMWPQHRYSTWRKIIRTKHMGQSGGSSSHGSLCPYLPPNSLNSWRTYKFRRGPTCKPADSPTIIRIGTTEMTNTSATENMAPWVYSPNGFKRTPLRKIWKKGSFFNIHGPY